MSTAENYQGTTHAWGASAYPVSEARAALLSSRAQLEAARAQTRARTETLEQRAARIIAQLEHDPFAARMASALYGLPAHREGQQ